MSNLDQASRQWSSRPADERFTSLAEMENHFRGIVAASRQSVISTKRLEAVPSEDNLGMMLSDGNGNLYNPTHYAFGQIAARAEAPAGYLRTMPSPIAADCINYGLQFKREISDVAILVEDNSSKRLRAATGPNYGRIWNYDIVRMLGEKFGDGVTGEWRVPGEFGKKIVVDQDNTTLYAGDRDMFVFLANEDNRIEIENRRDGKPGSLARGFFVWNSEVGDKSFGLATFLFDYVCKNRIVWGAENLQEVRIRHTSSAPDKWLSEIMPALKTYASATSDRTVGLIEAARQKKIDDVDEFLAKRYGNRSVDQLKAIHMLEEARPIETVWDVATAITAKARSVPYQDERIKLERTAGELLQRVAA